MVIYSPAREFGALWPVRAGAAAGAAISARDMREEGDNDA
jgi:hypothetical protein